MYIVSRHVGVNKFEIVDTDTGRKGCPAGSMLLAWVKINGMYIHGVELVEGEQPKIMPYQAPETLTPLQMKTKLMKHVDITTYGSSITAIRWNQELMTAPVSITLSDFGDTIEDCVIFDNVQDGTTKLTLILDDKLKAVSRKAFLYCSLALNSRQGFPRVVLDFSGISDDKLAEDAYWSLIPYRGEPFSGVVDEPVRKSRMIEKLL